MSLTFKLLSLAIRTAAKPIGNYIKKQAKEHDGFRRFAVAQAQRVHRIDMRMRLGILHDPEAQQRMHDRELKAAEDKKRKAETPTVRTQSEQKQYDEQKAKDATEDTSVKKKDEPQKVKIRPLSEARAIELGANFFSEAFIFAVAAGLLIWDSWRSRKKESARRDDVKERLEQLESEVESLRSKLDPDLETLHDLSERIKDAKRRRESASWWNPKAWINASQDAAIMEEGNSSKQMVQTEDSEKIEPLRKSKGIVQTAGNSAKMEDSQNADEIVHQEATKKKVQDGAMPKPKISQSNGQPSETHGEPAAPK